MGWKTRSKIVKTDETSIKTVQIMDKTPGNWPKIVQNVSKLIAN
jgi:hypothetical protein